MPQIATDPPVSEKQRRAMCAAAGGRSTLGIPKKVGEEFCGEVRQDGAPRWKDRRFAARDAEFEESKHPMGSSLPARDMTPRDWRGMLRGLFKFLMEEAREPEHAEGAARDAEFEEAKHPRDAGGKFGSGPGNNKRQIPLVSHEENLAAMRSLSFSLPDNLKDAYNKVSAAKFYKMLPVEDVPLNKVVSGQPELDPEIVNKYIDELEEKGKFSEPGAAILHNGKFYLMDQNHRTEAALRKGVKSLPMHVYRVPTATAKDAQPTALAPNSSLPAAGTLFIGPTNRVLFAKRSASGDRPGTWAFPGGACRPDETAAECARRETQEETGRDCAEDQMLLLDRRTTDDVDFATYLARCPEEFHPTLNDEHTAEVWVPWGMWPTPLHPGVAATLAALPEDVEELLDAAGEMSAEMAADVEMRRVAGGSLRPSVDLTTLTPLTERLLIRGEGFGRALHAHPGPMNVAKKPAQDGDETDTVTVDVPLLIRLLEVAREDAPDDVALHKIAERLVENRDRPLTMADYEVVTGGAEKPAQDGAMALDWRGVAELEEPATAQLVGYAFDRDTTRSYGPDGHLHVTRANISKACVNPYLGKEIPGYKELGLDPDKPYRLLRDPKEMARAVSTFNNLPILSTHRPVSADAHPPDLVIGSTGTDAEFNAPYLTNSLVFWPRSAIEAIESNERKQLSCAYRYVPDMTPGTYEGERYDGVMRDLCGNHLALVRDGRAGADVVVGDERPAWSSGRWNSMNRTWRSPRFALAQDAMIVKDAGTHEGAVKAAATRAAHGRAASSPYSGGEVAKKGPGSAQHHAKVRKMMERGYEAQADPDRSGFQEFRHHKTGATVRVRVHD